MKRDQAKKLIEKTRVDYNRIAGQFASTRKYNWTEVISTLDDILANFDKDKKIKILDIGCGAGRTYDFFKNFNIDYYGIDLSEELIKIAKKTYPKGHFAVGDATNLPYKDNEFDLVISIATIHHIPSNELRDKFSSEMYRVCKNGGWGFVETWYFWNKPEYIKRIIKSLFSKNSLPFGDFYRPWKNSKGEILSERYFHAWRVSELKNCLKKAGFKNIKIYNFYLKTRNLNIICQK